MVLKSFTFAMDQKKNRCVQIVEFQKFYEVVQ